MQEGEEEQEERYLVIRQWKCEGIDGGEWGRQDGQQEKTVVLTGKKIESNVQIGSRVSWEWCVSSQLTELDKMDDWARHCKVGTKRNKRPFNSQVQCKLVLLASLHNNM